MLICFYKYKYWFSVIWVIVSALSVKWNDNIHVAASNTIEFINKANIIHQGFYDYRLVEYVNADTPVKIICPIHGEFEQRPEYHIYDKRGCKKCGLVLMGQKRRLTTEKFIELARKKHGNLYDYSLSKYTLSSCNVQIICSIHGIFEQKPNGHLQGSGCPRCKPNYQFDTQSFIAKATDKHNGLYDYSKSVYISSKHALIVTCPKHGDFRQVAVNHLSGKGCAKCYHERISEERCKSTEQFIKESSEKHHDEYDYSESRYTNWNAKVKIICRVHGPFYQAAGSHLCGSRCMKCYGKPQSNTDEFIAKAKEIHGDLYTYNHVDYKTAIKIVLITCKKHGDFKQTPQNHLSGNGCSKCRKSAGEIAVEKTLKAIGADYKTEVSFSVCEDINKLRFDFVVSKGRRKIMIEYQGEQHYRAVRWSNMTQERANVIFAGCQRRDQIKREWCQAYGIPLLEIPYYELSNVQPIVTKFLQDNKFV